MAGLWYRAGTVSVTNGSKKVTGFGSLWKTTTYKPDKGHTFWGPDGKAYEIDYVESDTVLYLVMVYAGVTAASQAYSIDITRTSTIPAFSRELSAQLAYAQAQYDSWQQVLTGSGMVTLTAPDGQQVQVPALSAFQPTSASLKALQALTPAKDKLPVFNGPAGAELVTLTAYIRMLLDDVDDKAARTTLGAAPDGFGLGVTSTLSLLADFAAHNATGWYRALGNGTSTPTPGAPPGSGNNVLSVYCSHPVSGAAHYLVVENSEKTPVLWLGQMNAGAMKWTKCHTQATVLGTVSQSGGAPTGAIIERGSNANGEYVKFADGTAICSRRYSMPANSNNNAGTVIDTPITLVSTQFVSGQTNLACSATLAGSYVIEANPYNQSSVRCKVLVHTANSITDISVSVSVDIFVFGRWF